MESGKFELKSSFQRAAAFGDDKVTGVEGDGDVKKLRGQLDNDFLLRMLE